MFCELWLWDWLAQALLAAELCALHPPCVRLDLLLELFFFCRVPWACCLYTDGMKHLYKRATVAPQVSVWHVWWIFGFILARLGFVPAFSAAFTSRVWGALPVRCLLLIAASSPHFVCPAIVAPPSAPRPATCRRPRHAREGGQETLPACVITRPGAYSPLKWQSIR